MWLEAGRDLKEGAASPELRPNALLLNQVLLLSPCAPNPMGLGVHRDSAGLAKQWVEIGPPLV